MRISPRRRAEPVAAIEVSVLLSGAHSTIRRRTDNIYLQRAAEGSGGLWSAAEGRDEKKEEEEEEDEEEDEEDARQRRLRSNEED